MKVLTKEYTNTSGVLNFGFLLLAFFLLLSGLIFSGCGQKGPPEIIEKIQVKLKPVKNLNYQIKDSSILLKWESNYKQNISGFGIFMAKQNIKKCQGCPVVFNRIDFISPDLNEYQKELEKGYRYFFKIKTSGVDDIKSKSSETIKIDF